MLTTDAGRRALLMWLTSLAFVLGLVILSFLIWPPVAMCTP